MEGSFLSWILVIGAPLAYLMGLFYALDAVMKTRTAQGATAWVIALIVIPFLSLPFYWVFGRAKFDEYIRTLRDFDKTIEARLKEAREGELKNWLVQPEEIDDLRTSGELRGFQALSTLSFTHGNGVRLLLNGQQTFDAIFEQIDAARDYVLAQFYIIRDDDIGRVFKRKLIDAASRGVRVFLLYDEVGSHSLPRRYIQELSEAAVQVSGFSGKHNWLGRFRLNFRNHRKIVVVDGVKAFMGGLNVGDEYLGRDRRLSPWRDTHLALEGPIVQGLQFSFLRDWYYGRQESLAVRWALAPSPRNQRALILASGPVDTLETCGLLFTHAIESAEKRVWIATPYFVPDGRVLGALQLASLRGVDVRVLMPRLSDSILFKYVPYAYLPEVELAGVKVYIYEEGFMHQKAFVVDDDYAAVSTANFDNRSFLFNFEVTCLVNDAVFCDEVATMLTSDFTRSTRLTGDLLTDRPFTFRLATQLTRLLAPVL